MLPCKVFIKVVFFTFVETETDMKPKKLFQAAAFLLFLLASPAVFPQSYNNTRTDGYRGIWFELNQKYPFGDKYSGGLGTYTAHHYPMAVYAEKVAKTFFVYGGTTGENDRYLLCMIGSYDHRRHRVEKPVVVFDKQGVNDPHDNPSLAIDQQGYLWVFVSGRGKVRPGYKYRSVKPYSIDRFEQVTSEEMTYPQPWLTDQGFLHLFTKYTGVRELYFETSTDGYTWTDDQKLAGIREAGDTKGGHYQVSAAGGKVVGTFFNRHPDGNVDKRTDLYYLQTSDLGKTWTTVDGKPVATPLELVDNPARVVDYQSQQRNVYLCDMLFDEAANPVCLYVTSPGHQPGPGNSPRQWVVTRWTGTEWLTSVAGESDHNYDMGSLFISAGKWTILAPLVNGPQIWGAGGELATYESDDQGKTWRKALQLTGNSALNHNYARRSLHAREPFLFFWADGNPDHFSISHLYFGNLNGEVWQLPYQMKRKTARPTKVEFSGR